MADETRTRGPSSIVNGATLYEVDVNNNQAYLLNNSGGTVNSYDVLVADTTTDEAFTTTTVAGSLLPVYVVPPEATGSGAEASKAIANAEKGFVWAAGAVCEAAVDGAVSRYEYLKTGTTAGKFSATGTVASATQGPVSGASAIALEDAGAAGTITVQLLPLSSESLGGKGVDQTLADNDVLQYNSGTTQWDAKPLKRTLWFPHGAVGAAGGTLVQKGDFAAWLMTASGHNISMTFVVPADFSSLVSLDVIIISGETQATTNYTLTSDYGLPGTLHTTNSESSGSQSMSMTNNFLHTIDASGVFSSLAAGHICGLKYTLNSNHDVNALGVRMVYLVDLAA